LSNPPSGSAAGMLAAQSPIARARAGAFGRYLSAAPGFPATVAGPCRSVVQQTASVPPGSLTTRALWATLALGCRSGEMGMTSRRAFLRTAGGAALALGALSLGAQPSRKRVSVEGRPATVVDIHAHCAFPEVTRQFRSTPRIAPPSL